MTKENQPKSLSLLARLFIAINDDSMRQKIEALLDECPQLRDGLALIIETVLAEQALPEIKSNEKPLYKNRNNDPEHPELQDTNIAQWLCIVWGHEIQNRILTLQGLRKVDPEAASMASVWKTRGKFPDNIYLPTQKELNDAALNQPRTRAKWGSQTPEGSREVNRLGATARRRAKPEEPK